MKTLVALLAGKITHLVAKLFSLGAGGTWPGEIALIISPTILQHFISQLTNGIIIVAGTNGKTTSSLMIENILRAGGTRVIHNATGANLLNGVVSAFIQNSDWLGKIDADWGVVEIDENSLPAVVKEIAALTSLARNDRVEKKTIVILLNLFRDQLDRYGEVDLIAEKWERALNELPKNAEIVANSDDPLIAHIAKKSGLATTYFGIEDKKLFIKEKQHATDSLFCLSCGARLEFKGVFYSHLGIWQCNNCGEKRPSPEVHEVESVLPGVYNKYNALAAKAVGNLLKIPDSLVTQSLKVFVPAFGRQEEFEVEGKPVKIFLSKNPTGFNQSLKTVVELGAKHILFVLNDRIPDGRDVSWIWDVDFETLIQDKCNIIVSGDRVYDLALRMKYADKIDFTIEPKLEKSIEEGLNQLKPGETLYILSTYSAMLDVRKILKGRKIL